MITSPPLYRLEGKSIVFNKQKEIHFSKNFHPEFKGYIFEIDGGVWISVIEAKQIGKGYFSAFIRECKEKYSFIKIPTPSKMMIEVALHLGFNLKEEYFPEPFNEWGVIMGWKQKGDMII